jgi:NitT/TauT family transport system substrate-binding protein
MLKIFRDVSAVILAIALLLSSRASLLAQNPPPDLVRLGNLKFAHYAAVAYMKELAPKYNLEIKEQMFTKGLDIVPAIISGDIDIAASALEAAIAGRAGGAKVFIIAGFAKGGVRLVGRNDLNLNSVTELKGRKVGVTRGGPQELCLLAELAMAGLTWSDQPGAKDVHLVYLSYPDLNQALQAGQIDAMSQSEPQSAQAIAKGFGKEIMKPYDTSIGEPTRALVMTEKMFVEKPDVARRVLLCFTDATQKLIADPALAEKYVREVVFKGELTHDDYIAAVENAHLTYDISAEHVQATTDLMVKNGVAKLQNPPVATDYVRLEPLQKAKQTLGVK